MVAPPTYISLQSIRLIRDSVGSLITMNEALARIELLRNMPEPTWTNGRPSNRELLDYMNYQGEADDLELQIEFIINSLTQVN